jgi:hypothetical protein
MDCDGAGMARRDRVLDRRLVGQSGSQLEKSMNTQACWYCNEDRGPLVFCTEFDTYVHVACVKQAAKDANDQEAQIIANEILGDER